MIGLPNLAALLTPNAGVMEDVGPSTPPVAPVAAPAPPVAPPVAPVNVPAPVHPSGLAQTSAALKQLLPVLLSTIALKKGGPIAANQVLGGFAAQAEEKRKQDAEQQKLASEMLGKQQDFALKAATLQNTQSSAIETFVQHLQNDLSGVTDPATFASTVKQAGEFAHQVYGVDPGLITNRFTYDNTKKLKKDKDEAAALITQLQSMHKDDFNDLVDQGATVTFQGQRKPLKDVLALAGLDVQSVSGDTIKPETGILPVGTEAQTRMAAVETAKKAAKAAGKPFTQTDAMIAADEASRQWKKTHQVATNTTGEVSSDPKDIAAGIADGTLPPTLATQGNAKERFAIAATLKRTGVNLSSLISNWLGTQRAIASLNSNQQIRLVENIDKASDSLDKVDTLNQQLTQAMPRGQFKTFNRAALAVAKSGAWGQQAAQAANLLEGQIADLTAEIANVYMGGNSPTDHGLELASKNLNSSWDQTTLTSAINQARYNLNLAQNSRNDLLTRFGAPGTIVPTTESVSSGGFTFSKSPDGTWSTAQGGVFERQADGTFKRIK